MPTVRYISGIRSNSKTVSGAKSPSKSLVLTRNPMIGGQLKLVIHNEGDGTNLERLRHSLRSISLEPKKSKRYVNL